MENNLDLTLFYLLPLIVIRFIIYFLSSDVLSQVFLLPRLGDHKLYNDFKHCTEAFLAFFILLHQRVDVKFLSKFSTVTDATSRNINEQTFST